MPWWSNICKGCKQYIEAHTCDGYDLGYRVFIHEDNVPGGVSGTQYFCYGEECWNYAPDGERVCLPKGGKRVAPRPVLDDNGEPVGSEIDCTPDNDSGGGTGGNPGGGGGWIWGWWGGWGGGGYWGWGWDGDGDPPGGYPV